MVPGSRSSSRLSTPMRIPMPVISEDAVVPPIVPPRSPRRPTGSARASYRSSVSPNTSSAVVPPGSLAELARKEVGNVPPRVTRRKWYKWFLLGLLIVGIIIGLSVGLTIGLRKRAQSSTIPPPLPTDIFPAGSFSFTTALSNVSTACSPTWRCFPFSVYDRTNPSLSAATFHWSIEPVTLYSYAISSSPNPFAPSFSRIEMALLDPNAYLERFIFNFTMDKPVSVARDVSEGGEGSDGSNDGTGGGNSTTTTCWFNGTVVSATIWTRVRATYPANISDVEIPVNDTDRHPWAPWPFAVEVHEVGEGEPDCRDGAGNPVEVPGVVDGGGTGDEECGCGWRNFGLGGNETAAALPIR